MNPLTVLKTAFTAVFLCLVVVLGGCSTFETLGDYVSENPVFVSVASRQAVAAYIATGKTDVEQAEKAKQVNATVSKALIYLEGDPEATVDSLMALVDSEINWEGLTIRERFIVQDLMSLVETELRKYEVQNGVISETTALAVRGLLLTAQSAAHLYLVK